MVGSCGVDVKVLVNFCDEGVICLGIVEHSVMLERTLCADVEVVIVHCTVLLSIPGWVGE